MKKALFWAIAAAGVAFSQASFAADLPARTYTKAPPMLAPVEPWTGFHIGGQIGYGWGDWDHDGLVSTVGPAFVAPGFPVGSITADGVVGGLNLGFDKQFGNFLLGIEADLNWSDVKGSKTIFVTPSLVGGGWPLAVAPKLDYYGTVRARAGMVFDKALFYGTGGWAYGHAKSTISGLTTFPVAGIPFSTSPSGDLSGWTAGAGIDYMVTPNVILGIEYKHIDFGQQNYTYVFPAANVTSSANITLDEVTARAMWKF